MVSPYDPMNRHLKVDKNISLRAFCRDKGEFWWTGEEAKYLEAGEEASIWMGSLRWRNGEEV